MSSGQLTQTFAVEEALRDIANQVENAIWTGDNTGGAVNGIELAANHNSQTYTAGDPTSADVLSMYAAMVTRKVRRRGLRYIASPLMHTDMLSMARVASTTALVSDEGMVSGVNVPLMVTSQPSEPAADANGRLWLIQPMDIFVAFSSARMLRSSWTGNRAAAPTSERC